MKSYPVSPFDAGIRLERFLRKNFPQISLVTLQKFLRTKKIGVFRNGERQKVDARMELFPNDEVRIFFDTEKFDPLPQKPTKDFSAILKHPKFQSIKIPYEDEHLLVLEKPAGIAVHPGSKVQFGHSLIDYCIARERTKDARCPEPKLVHRIDKNTSGLVMVAKNDAVLRKLTAMIREGTIKKEYIALVKGQVSPKKGTIRTFLEKTEGSKYTKISVASEGKESVTHYEVELYDSPLKASLVRVFLETGRMHQIRVHFAEKGHPLAGDDAYGDFAWNKELFKAFHLSRQFLHAVRLSFLHPVTGKNIIVNSPLPGDLKKLLP